MNYLVWRLANRWVRFVTLCVAYFLMPKACQAQISPNLRIVFFGSTRAHESGKEPVSLIAVVQNVGEALASGKEFAIRLTCFAGLEYGNGETIISVNDLSKDATQIFKWNVEPRSNMLPLMASVSLEKNGQPIDVKIVTLQTGAEIPPAFTPAPPTKPIASVKDDRAWLENDRMRVQLSYSDAAIPILSVYARYASGWRKAGIISPLATITSSEFGQTPWEETFRIEQIHASTTSDSATLMLSGGIGLRWRASVTINIRKGSGIMEQQISLSPLRSMRVSQINWMPLYAGSGGFGNQVSEPILDFSSETTSGFAVRNGDLTIASLCSKILTGIAIDNLRLLPTLRPEQVSYIPFITNYVSVREAVVYAPGSLLTIRSRIALLFPSKAVLDASRISLPIQK